MGFPFLGIRIGKGGGSSGPNGAPSGLTLTVVNATTLQASFSSGSSNQDGYRAYIGTNGTDFPSHVDNAATAFNLTGLTAGTLYYVYIVAYKGTKESSISNIAQYKISTLLTGLLAHWRFDETSGNAIDSKSGYVLTNNNSVTYVSGLIDRVANTGNSNTNKSLTINNGFGLTYQSPTTQSIWVLINTAPSANTTHALFSLIFGTNPGNYRTISYRDVGGQKQIVGRALNNYAVTLTTGIWYHFLHTWDHVGNVSKLYLDGVLRVTDVSFATDQSAQTTRLAIGNVVNVNFASARFDEARLWNRILTDDEIAEDYTNGESYPFPYFPKMATGVPSAGTRNKVALAGWNAAIYHSMYLPTNYSTNRTWPIIIELPGNANQFANGLPNDDYYMGWGLSHGQDFIHIIVPFLNAAKTAMAPTWWGDGSDPTTQSITSTQDYWTDVIADAVANYHGDVNKIVLMGYSRGAIAVNYIGCSDDNWAAKFCAFMPHSHMDGGTYTPTGASTRIARMLGKKCCVTYGDSALDGGYANSQTGLGLVQAAGVTEEHYGIAGQGHGITHVLKEGDATVDSIRAFLAQYK